MAEEGLPPDQRTPSKLISLNNMRCTIIHKTRVSSKNFIDDILHLYGYTQEGGF